MTNKFDEWAKRFEPYVRHSFGTIGEELVMARCMYPVKEGPHMRACMEDAVGRSTDGYRTCGRHQGLPLRKRWKGYVEGV